MQPSITRVISQLTTALAEVDKSLATISVADVEDLQRFSSLVPVIVLVPRSSLRTRVACNQIRRKQTNGSGVGMGRVLKLADASLRRLQFSDVTVNFSTMEVHRRGELVALRRLEFETLKYMAINEGKVLSRDELLNEVWGYYNYPCTRTVDNCILRLRQKLESDPGNPVHFQTVFSVGYRFRLEAQDLSIQKTSFRQGAVGSIKNSAVPSRGLRLVAKNR